MVTDIFNRIVTYARLRIHLYSTVLRSLFSSCHAKCISPRYAEGDLNKGESVCIDRCVAKYFEVNKKVGEKLQTAGANAQQTGTFGP